MNTEPKKIAFVFPFGAWVKTRLKRALLILAVCWVILLVSLSGDLLSAYLGGAEAWIVGLCLFFAPVLHFLGLYLKYRFSDDSTSEFAHTGEYFTFSPWIYMENLVYRFHFITYRRGFDGLILGYAHVMVHLAAPDVDGNMQVHTCISMKQLRQILALFEEQGILRK